MNWLPSVTFEFAQWKNVQELVELSSSTKRKGNIKEMPKKNERAGSWICYGVLMPVSQDKFVLHGQTVLPVSHVI